MEEMSEWENINRILGRHGCGAVQVSPRDECEGGVVLDSQASLALRAAIKSLVKDNERRQTLIHGLIQSNSLLKDDVRLQQDRAERQERRAEELQHILDDIRAKIRDLEDDFLSTTQAQQSEERRREQSIAQIARAEAAEQKRLQTGRQNLQPLMEPQHNSHLHQRILDVVDGYEIRVKQLQEEVRGSQSSEALDRGSSGESLDLDPTPNYKALIKSYQEQIQEARRKEEALLRENDRLQRENDWLQRENDRLQREVEARASGRELRAYKKQMRKMEKILGQNNGRDREGKEAEPHAGVRGEEPLPQRQCQRYLQILADISAVVSGPRAPPLLVRPRSRLQVSRRPEILDESDFLQLPPTIELWAGELRALQMLHRSLRRLNRRLRPPLQEDSCEEAAAGVRVEELLLLVDTMVEDVENRRPRPPSASPHVLQALVSHFQKLFDVPSVSGVFPRMNEVYSKVGEVGNAMKTLRCLLGLGDAARAEVVVDAVGRLCGETGAGLPLILGTLDLDSVINKVQEHEEFFPAFEELITDLLSVLEIDHLEEILPEVQRLKAR